MKYTLPETKVTTIQNYALNKQKLLTVYIFIDFAGNYPAGSQDVHETVDEASEQSLIGTFQLCCLHFRLLCSVHDILVTLISNRRCKCFPYYFPEPYVPYWVSVVKNLFQTNSIVMLNVVSSQAIVAVT